VLAKIIDGCKNLEQKDCSIMTSFIKESFDKAKLVFSNDPGDDVEEQQPDRLEELAEYCPTLTFQQVSYMMYPTPKRFEGCVYLTLLSLPSHLFPFIPLQRLIGFAICFGTGCTYRAVACDTNSMFSHAALISHAQT
jgi:hypothetical protein